MQWKNLRSRIPTHLAADFEAEWLKLCYDRCQFLASITLYYPLIVVALFFVRRMEVPNPAHAVVLLTSLALLLCVSLLTKMTEAKGRAELASMPHLFQQQSVQNYALALILYTNATFAALWDLEGINSSYILGIFIFGAIFYRPCPSHVLIYVTSLAHYFAWVLVIPQSLIIQSVAIFAGIASTFGSWIIGSMLFHAQLTSFIKSYTIQTQAQDLKRLNQHLKSLASTDGLTQLANRRYFDQMFDGQFPGSDAQPLPLGVLLCDVDYFKKFNDTYGHQAGDHCLWQVAQAIQSVVRREGDLVARYGGEEFVVMLTQSSPTSVMEIATRICQRVRELGIEHQESPHHVVTLSIGAFCAHPAHLATPGQFIAQADQALYRAKAQGRDQVAYGSMLTASFAE